MSATPHACKRGIHGAAATDWCLPSGCHVFLLYFPVERSLSSRQSGHYPDWFSYYCTS